VFYFWYKGESPSQAEPPADTLQIECKIIMEGPWKVKESGRVLGELKLGGNDQHRVSYPIFFCFALRAVAVQGS
jgi:hypothetical protein